MRTNELLHSVPGVRTGAPARRGAAAGGELLPLDLRELRATWLRSGYQILTFEPCEGGSWRVELFHTGRPGAFAWGEGSSEVAALREASLRELGRVNPAGNTAR